MLFLITFFYTSVSLFSFAMAQSTHIPLPRLSVESYILIDYATGDILVERNAKKRVEPASLSKIMTVAVVADALKSKHITLDEKVVVSEKAWRMQGSRMFIEVGKSVSVNELLDGVIVQSGNDSSVALAEHLYGSEAAFVDQMNALAEDLNMVDSKFGNATGMPNINTFVTARDIATLSRHLISKHPEIYKRFSMTEFSHNGIKQKNRNVLLFRDKAVDGIKTGYTKSAGYCLVTSSKKGGMRLISAVMGAKSSSERVRNTKILLQYGHRFFEVKEVLGRNSVVTSVPIYFGAKDTLSIGVTDSVVVNIPKGSADKISIETFVDDKIKAPIKENAVLGKVIISHPDKPDIVVPLKALQSIESGSVLQKLSDYLKLLVL